MNREVLHIGIRESGTTRVLKLTGELDSYTSDRLRSISETWIPGANKVVVNLDKLEYIDSSGLAALVGLWVKSRDNGVEMVLSCRNRRVQKIMEITGLSRLFGLDGAKVAAGIVPQSTYNTAAMMPATRISAVAKGSAYGETIIGSGGPLSGGTMRKAV